MDPNEWLSLSVVVLGLAALGGFFKTKTSGFGRFNTSTLLALLVLAFSALFTAGGRLEPDAFVSILLAVLGFGAGLFAGKDS